MPAEHDPYAVLKYPEYVRYVLSHFLDIFGMHMLTTAVGWELYERTGSAFVLGMVGLMQFLPAFFLSLPVGHIVDSCDRKVTLLVAQLLMMLATAALTVVSWRVGPIGGTYACLFVMGTASVLSLSARAAFFPRLIPASGLHNAVTWNNSSRQLATVLGPVTAGLTIALSGTARWSYLGYILCSLVFMILIAGIRSWHDERSTQRLSLASLFTGIRFIARTRIILATISLDLFAVLFGGATALLPLFAKDILHVGPAGLGWLRTAPALGAIVISLVISHLPPMRRAGPAMLWAVAGYGLSMVIFGLSTTFSLSLFMLLLSGALDAVSVIVRHTLLQVLTPPSMLGRVYAVNTLFGISSNELGGFESGLTAQMFGPTVSVAGGGVASILIVLLSMVLWPEIIRLGSFDPQVSRK